MIDKVSALKWIEEYKQNPVFDLDNPPDFSTFPKAYQIHGRKSKNDAPPGTLLHMMPHVTHFQVDKTYATKAEAESQVETMKKTWEYLIPESIEIREVNQEDVSTFKFIQLLHQIFVVEGQEEPLYLP